MGPEDFSAQGDAAHANADATGGDAAGADRIAPIESNEPNRSATPPVDPGPLSELETLIGELKEKVSALREGDLDAATLESKLRELTELASRAASTLDSASR
jgi:hypothetical protein